MNKKQIKEKEMAHTAKCPKSKSGPHSWVPNGRKVINKLDYQLHRCVLCKLEGMEIYVPGENTRGSCG